MSSLMLGEKLDKEFTEYCYGLYFLFFKHKNFKNIHHIIQHNIVIFQKRLIKWSKKSDSLSPATVAERDESRKDALLDRKIENDKTGSNPSDTKNFCPFFGFSFLHHFRIHTSHCMVINVRFQFLSTQNSAPINNS